MAANRLLARPWLPGVELFHADFSGQAFGRHSHSAFAIGSILHGVGGYQCRGRRHALPAGTLSLMNPEEPHTGHAESERLVYRMLYVEETRLLGLLGRKQLPRGFGELNPADDGSVAVGLARLAEDFQRSDALGLESRLLALLEQVFVRHGGLRPAAAPATAEPPHACAITWKRMPPRALGLDQLAQLLQRHPRHLIEAFRRAYGVPPHTYQLQCRVRQAKRLLLEERPLAELAQHLGFYDQAHFSTTFRRFTGVTGAVPAQRQDLSFSNTAPAALQTGGLRVSRGLHVRRVRPCRQYPFRCPAVAGAGLLPVGTRRPAARPAPGRRGGRRHRPGQPPEHAAGARPAGQRAGLGAQRLALAAGARRTVLPLAGGPSAACAEATGNAGAARRPSRGGYLRGLRDGLLASSLNPKLPIFYAGLFGVLARFSLPGWALALCLAWMSLAVLCWDMALVRLLDRPRWRGWLQRRVGALDRLCGVLLLALGGWLVLAAL